MFYASIEMLVEVLFLPSGSLGIDGTAWYFKWHSSEFFPCQMRKKRIDQNKIHRKANSKAAVMHVVRSA